MAETSVLVNPGSITPIETRSTPNGSQQQVIVLGVPDQNATITGSAADGLLVQAAKSASSALSNVAGNASSVQLLASNTSRKGVLIYNDSTAVLYVALTSTAATTTAYSFQVAAQGYFELPGPFIYTGRINGVWASATGSARITELS